MQQETKRKQDGFNLSLARKWKKMSQSDLAMLLGMHQTQISSLEEKEKIDDAILKKIADAMHIPFDFFTDFDLGKAVGNYTVSNTGTYTMGENSTQTENNQIKQVENEVVNNNPVEQLMELTTKLEEYAFKLGKLEAIKEQLRKENEHLKQSIK